MLKTYSTKTNETAALFVDIVNVTLKGRMFFHMMYQENIQIIKSIPKLSIQLLKLNMVKIFWKDWRLTGKTKTFGPHLSTVEHNFKDEDRAGRVKTFNFGDENVCF